MKKVLYVLIILIIAGFVGFYFVEKQTSKPPSTSVTPTIEVATPTMTDETPCRAIKIISPQPLDKISTPTTIKAIVDNTGNCHWTVFEAQAGTVALKDSNGNTLGKGVLTTSEEWTAAKPVNYTAKIVFSKPLSKNGELTITEGNPSGKPNPKTITETVTF